MTEEKLVLIDIDVMHWTVAESRLYRAAVGVNPEYAIGALKAAADESAAESKRVFGDGPVPDDWMPLPLFNIDPGYLLGFAWMAARRTEPKLTFEEYAGQIETGALMTAFYSGVTETVEAEDEAPLEEPTQLEPRKTSSATKPPSRSASSSAAGL